MATTRFHLPPILALLDRKGDPNIQDDGGHTVLDKLDRNSTKAVADWLEWERGGTWPWTINGNETCEDLRSLRNSAQVSARLRKSSQVVASLCKPSQVFASRRKLSSFYAVLRRTARL
jgi:hypothetical protein